MKAGHKTINKAQLVPGIVIDIDGVITKGVVPIDNSPNVVKALLKSNKV
jgi:ribonucleotide monophosphatase NagD (HAD superfamily)